MFNKSRLLVALCVTATTLTLVARAADVRLPIPPVENKNRSSNVDDIDPKTRLEEYAGQQDRLRRQFEEFKLSLLRLKQRLESSPKPEDKEKARVLNEVLAKANEQGTDTKFSDLVTALQNSEAFKDLDQLQTILDKNEDIRKDIRLLIELLQRDDRDAQIRAEKERDALLLEKLKKVIQMQEKTRSQVELNRKNSEDLKKLQEQVTKETKQLVDNKPQSQNDDSNSRVQNLIQQQEKLLNETEKMSKQSSHQEQSKDGQPKDGQQAKDASNSQKNIADQVKNLSDTMQQAQNNASPERQRQLADALKLLKERKVEDQLREAAGKLDNKKAADAIPQQKKALESLREVARQLSDSQQVAKANGPQGQPKDGSQGQPKDGSRGGQQPANNQHQQNDPVRKQIEEGTKYQENAEQDLVKDMKPKALKDQDDAIRKLRGAQRKLEDMLRQLREEEIERILAALQGRCQRMRDMQIAVRDGTVALGKAVNSKEPSREEQQKSNLLSDDEEAIIREANQAINIIEAEGTAIAFATVFHQVRDDMISVATRLRKTDTDAVTQTIENDIITTLGEMIEALKQARKQNQQQPQPLPPQQPPQEQKKQPQPLINLLNELKLIRSRQIRLNQRTNLYGHQYKGEQVPALSAAPDPKTREQNESIQQELRKVGANQRELEKVTSDIAKGKNKSN